MLADALREIRHHWSRVVATLVAIALSVGFMVAVSTFLAVESKSLGRQSAVFSTKADLVVTLSRLKEFPHPVSPIADALSRVSGVEAAEQLVQTTGVISAGDTFRTIELLVVSERFRWSHTVEGRWPTKPLELALGRDSARDLGVGLGDSVTVDGEPATIVGITDDPRSYLFPFGFRGASPQPKAERDAHGFWLVDLADGADPGAAATGIAAALEPFAEMEEPYPDAGPAFEVMTAAEFQADTVDQLTGQSRGLKLMIMVFAVIALLVGMIIIANTFKILLAQRRRQIGLLRAVGASGAQVRNRLLAEAFWIGLFGSLIGVVVGIGAAAIASFFTGSLQWAWTVPWVDVGVEIVVGVIITIVAAVAPALSATRVSPLEALQPVMTIEQSRRASRIRIGVAAVLGAIGAGLAVGSLSAGEQSLPFALGAGFAITAAVVGLAPLFVPPLLNLAGRLFGRSSRIVQLAAENAARNPSRAAATATALMLAVGLIVTLQVGAESMRRTVAGQIDASFPIDLEIMRFPAQIDDPESSSPLPRNFLPIIESLPNVGQKAILEGIPVELVKTDEDFQAVTALVYTDQMSTFLADTASGLPDGLVWVSRGQADPNLRDGGQTTLRSLAGEVTLKVHLADEIDSSTVVVSPATASRLGVKPEVVGAWIKLADRYRLADTASALAAQKWEGEMIIAGSAFEAWTVEKVISLLLRISTGLLAVAVLIALVGVANTLSLSVIERSRESALLRALGLQRRELRLMLLYEALLLSGIAVAVGIVAGVFFGWLGIRSLMTASGMDPSEGFVLAVNAPMTLLLVAIAIGAAALASIGPGRRAANAAPIEVLAEE